MALSTSAYRDLLDKAAGKGKYSTPDATAKSQVASATKDRIAASQKNSTPINNTPSNYGPTSGIGSGDWIGTGKAANPTNLSRELQPVQQPVQQNQEVLDYINKLKQSNITSGTAALDQSRNSILSQLESERKGVQPRYSQAANNASSGSQLRADKLRKLMQERGFSEGLQGQEEISSNVALQGELGSLESQRQNELSDISRRVSGTESDYQTGITQLKSGVDAQALQSLINQVNANRQFGLQESSVTGTYNGQQTPDARQQEIQNYLSTIGGFGQDYQAEINKVQGDGDTSNDWQVPYLQTARQQKLAEMSAAQAPPQLTSSSALDLWQQIGSANESISKALGIPVGTRFTPSYSGSGSGSSTVSKTTSKSNPAQQLSAYNQFTSSLRGFRSTNEVLQYIGNNYDKLVGQMGVDLVNQLVTKYQGAIEKPSMPTIEEQTIPVTELDIKPYADIISKSYIDEITGAVDIQRIAKYLDLLESQGIDTRITEQLATLYGL
jgi:hypothetical protein